MTGEDLKARRKGMGYTQEGLGKVLGVSRNTRELLRRRAAEVK